MKHYRNQAGASLVEWLVLLALVAVVAIAFVSIVSDDRPIFDTQPQAVTSTSTTPQGR